MINACLATGYTLLTRVLSRTESTMALMLHTALVGTVVFSAVVLVLGIFLLVFGSLTGAGFAIIAAVVAIPTGLGLLGWSVVDRNRKL